MMSFPKEKAEGQRICVHVTEHAVVDRERGKGTKTKSKDGGEKQQQQHFTCSKPFQIAIAINKWKNKKVQFCVSVHETGGVLFSAKRPNTRTPSTYLHLKLPTPVLLKKNK